MPRVNYSDNAFNKTEHKLTKNNINDEYIKHPPHNRPEETSFLNEHKQQYTAGRDRNDQIDDEAMRVDELPSGAQDESLGRMKKVDDLAAIAQEDSVHG